MNSFPSVLKAGVAGLALLVGVAFVAGEARADATTVTVTSLTYSPNITGTITDVASGTSEGIYVGAISMTVVDSTNGTTTVVPVYCIDVPQNINLGNVNYSYATSQFNTATINEGTATSAGFTNLPLTVTTSVQSRITALIENTVVNNAVESAALQVAIWAAEYGNGVYSLTSSTSISIGSLLTLSSLTATDGTGGSTVAQLAIQDLGGSTAIAAGKSLTVYNGSAQNSQTMVGTSQSTTNSVVPEPATLSLFGAGLIAVAARFRRNRAAR